MLAAKPAILAEFQLVRGILFVLGAGVITLLALGAGKSDDIPHEIYPSAPAGAAGEGA
jgi:hypothetical protein